MDSLISERLYQVTYRSVTGNQIEAGRVHTKDEAGDLVNLLIKCGRSMIKVIETSENDIQNPQPISDIRTMPDLHKGKTS